MLSHERIWAAIDVLAERHALSVSGLARRAGLDPTTFNRSKRVAHDGRPRWPSTESIAKILDATKEPIERFFGLAEPDVGPSLVELEGPFRQVSLVGFARAGAGGFIYDGDSIGAAGLDDVSAPYSSNAEPVYALKVIGESMMPLYRPGDVIIASLTAQCRTGDRVVVVTRQSEIMAKVLARRDGREFEFASLNPEHPNITIPISEVERLARIIWASQ